MLLGQFEHTIDDKNRLTLPARFRDRFSEGIVVTPGIDPCLWAYPRGDWQQLAETRLASLDPLNQESRRIRRYFFAAAQDAELDRQGRVILPASLVGHAKLKREVVVAGVYDHLEINQARMTMSRCSPRRFARASRSSPATQSSTRHSAPAGTLPCSRPTFAAAAS
jgi:MraZ protein